MPYYRCLACGLTSYSAAGYSAALACPYCSAALVKDEEPATRRGIERAQNATAEAIARSQATTR
jgi:DNA-directed RNA polymerase subunit RPC12/RpoP